MKKFLSFFVTVILVLSYTGVYAYASDYKDIHITSEELYSAAADDKMTIAGVIENALLEAKENAGEKCVYRVFLPSGSYTLESGLHIYSNTELYLENDTVLVRGFDSGNMIKLGVEGEETEKYNGYKNIVISGGVWESGFRGSSCAMRFAHCTNVTVTGVTINNIKDAHHIEFAAADNFNVLNCTFSGMKRTGSSSCEALQIDIIHEYEHFPSYAKYDDTPCRNVTVSGCTFRDLYSGIGTRSGVVGSYFDNISIVDNSFSNITEKAITCLNYVNSRISGNTISDATSGIILESYPIGNSQDRLYMPNNSVTPVIKGSLNCEISGNTISVSNNLSSVDCCAVTVYGTNVNTVTAEKDGVLSGSYLAKDVVINNNVIMCNSASARGVFLTGVEDSELVGNRIYSFSSSNDGINGVNFCDSSYNTIQSNEISGTFNNGFSLYDGKSTGLGSVHNGFYSNTVSSVKSYGIRIASGSSATVKYNNNISLCGKAPLLISSIAAPQYIGSVSMKSITRSGRGRVMLRWNVLDGADGYKIYRSLTPNGEYRQIATVKGNQALFYEDKATRTGHTYYYKISPYTVTRSSVVICVPSSEYAAAI